MGIISAVQVDLVDRGQVLPAVVLVDEQGVAQFHRELLASTRKFRASGWSDSHIERYVRTIRQLAKYYIARGSPALDEDGLRQLIWDYLGARLYGTYGRGDVDLLGLYWRPSRWTTVRHECRAIADYSDYCASTAGFFPLVDTTRVPHKVQGLSHTELQRLKTIVERSVLGHLKLLGRKAARLPMPGRKTGGNSSLGREVMSAQQAWDLIDAERNPVYRMVWILGFWGGPRISEQLNMWRLDVLPGELRRALFDRDAFRDLPLVVLANPWESTYCGSIGNATITRREFLRDQFGLLPRPDLKWASGGRDKGLWVGWKGMLEENEARHVSQVYWINDEAAREYMQLHAALVERHRELGTYGRHPYLLINLDPRQSDVLGLPLRISNVCKAWERAIKRIGLTPYRFGASPHGMRHFFKAYLESLGVSKKVRQIALHHRSEDSQDAYGGLTASGIWHALEIGRRRARQNSEC